MPQILDPFIKVVEITLVRSNIFSQNNPSILLWLVSLFLDLNTLNTVQFGFIHDQNSLLTNDLLDCNTFFKCKFNRNQTT